MKPAVTRRPTPATATLAQVKALADPLRYRVFENLMAEPRTAKQMAEHLGTRFMFVQQETGRAML